MAVGIKNPQALQKITLDYNLGLKPVRLLPVSLALPLGSKIPLAPHLVLKPLINSLIRHIIYDKASNAPTSPPPTPNKLCPTP